MGELEQSITLSEFYEWQRFFSTEPLASERNEAQMAMLLSMLASFMGASKEDSKASNFLISKQNESEKKPSLKELSELAKEFLMG